MYNITSQINYMRVTMSCVCRSINAALVWRSISISISINAALVWRAMQLVLCMCVVYVCVCVAKSVHTPLLLYTVTHICYCTMLTSHHTPMCHLKIICVEERMATGVSLVIIHHLPPQNHLCRGENGHWSVTSHHTPMCHLKIMCVEERMATGVSLVIIHPCATSKSCV